MKILFINKFLHPNGGSETYIFKLGEELVRQGHEVQYFGMEHEGRIVANHAEQYVRDMDFHAGGLGKLLYPFKIIYSREAARKLTKVLEDFRPNVIHLNNFNFQLTPSVIYATRKWEKRTGNRLKIVYTAHDYQWVCPNHMMLVPSARTVCFQCKGGRFSWCVKNKCIHDSKIKSLLGAFEGWLYRRLGAYEKVDLIICPSEFIKQQLSTYKQLANRLLVMHNFVEVESYLHDRSAGLSEDYVLYFGRYTVEKGVQTLLEVCKMLPEIYFKFAGDGELFDQIERCENADNLGFLRGEELQECIKKARFVIFPSEWNENCPFSVMEALSMGIPVIASRIGGVPELVQDGVNGAMFEAGDNEALCELVNVLWKDHELREHYAEGAQKTKFASLQSYAEELLKRVY